MLLQESACAKWILSDAVTECWLSVTMGVSKCKYLMGVRQNWIPYRNKFTDQFEMKRLLQNSVSAGFATTTT